MSVKFSRQKLAIVNLRLNYCVYQTIYIKFTIGGINNSWEVGLLCNETLFHIPH